MRPSGKKDSTLTSQRDTRALSLVIHLRLMVTALITLVSFFSPGVTRAQVDSTMAPVDSSLTVFDSTSVKPPYSGPGITSEEFSGGSRRLIVPGSGKNYAPPIVTCDVDSGSRQFKVTIAPYDTSRLLGKFSQYFSGNRPLKFKAIFPDSLTLQLVVQTTPFSEIKPSYNYQEKQIYIDILDKRVEAPVQTATKTASPPIVPARDDISKVKPPPPVTRSFFGFQSDRPMLVMALFAAAVFIILGVVLVTAMLVVRGLRRRKAQMAVEGEGENPEPTESEESVVDNFSKSENEEIIKPVTTSPSEKTNPPERSAADTEIRKLMKQHGVTYDEARIMVWMKQRRSKQ